MALKCDLKEFALKSLEQKFDVIVVDPPWKEYHYRTGGLDVFGEDLSPWSFQEIASLKIEDVMAERSFLFLWVGETHLEEGRALFSKWGLRRIEDICWIKTNRTFKQMNPDEYVDRRNTNFLENDSYLFRTKEHCLMGIKGTCVLQYVMFFVHYTVARRRLSATSCNLSLCDVGHYYPRQCQCAASINTDKTHSTRHRPSFCGHKFYPCQHRHGRDYCRGARDVWFYGEARRAV